MCQICDVAASDGSLDAVPPLARFGIESDLRRAAPVNL